MTKNRSFGKTYIKNIIREIKGSLGRCIAIVLIVFLATGVVTGLKVFSPYMKMSMDKYYRDHSVMDVFIKSKLGLTEEDREAILLRPEIKSAVLGYSLDKLIEAGNGQLYAAKIIGQNLEGEASLNRTELIEGRLPKEANECLVIAKDEYYKDIKIGESLSISGKNENFEGINDEFGITEFTVTGIVKSPLYFARAQESTGIGSGIIDTIIYTLPEAFSLEVYTDLYLCLEGTENLLSYTPEYNDYTDEKIKGLEAFGQERIEARYKEVYDDAISEINDARAEFEEEKAKAEKELNDAKEELDKAKAELDDAEKKINDGLMEWEDGKRMLSYNKRKYKKEIEAAEGELAAGEEQVALAKAELEAGRTELEANAKNIEVLRRIAADTAKLPEEYRDEFEVIGEETMNKLLGISAALVSSDMPADEKLQILNILTNIGIQLTKLSGSSASGTSINVAEAISQYDAARIELETAETMLAEQEKLLQEGRIQLELGRLEAESEFSAAQYKLNSAKRKLDEAKAELANGKQEYYSGFSEYSDAKEEAEAEFRKAEEELADAERELIELADSEWYILSKESTVSYASFLTNIGKVDVIVGIFPVFFMLVALLVSLTTMTRMVEEQRIQIGTLKALGFTKAAIVGKYAIYSGISSIIGAMIGVPLGIWILPRIIYGTFVPVYDLPELIIGGNAWVCLAITALCLLCTVGSAIYSCMNSMREKPAALLLPKTPKAGKRILLERIKPLWKRMSFSYKATARNIIRNKKNLFMTVLGVAGCTALLLIGFGLNTSIENVAEKQYRDIFKYDLSVKMEEDANIPLAVLKFGKESYLKTEYSSAEIISDNKSYIVDLYSPEDESRFDEFVGLHDPESGDKIAFDENSVILSLALADEIGAEEGSIIKIKNSDGRTAELSVTGMTQNFTGAFTAIGKAAYEEAFWRYRPNAYLIKTGISEPDTKDEVMKELLGNDEVAGANLISGMKGIFDNLLSSMDFVIIFIIAASGALVATVLYNLTNININERKRELAALRVLGYHKREVGRYIFREIIILCFIGTLTGLLVGKYLYEFVMRSLESYDLMFERQAEWQCYLHAGLLTMLFSFVVDLLMYKTKVKKIDMAESMKAVE